MILLALPGAIPTADAVRHAISAAFESLPSGLRRTLTWDHGKELALHQQITASTGIRVFFCDAHAPWQRASNENMSASPWRSITAPARRSAGAGPQSSSTPRSPPPERTAQPPVTTRSSGPPLRHNAPLEDGHVPRVREQHSLRWLNQLRRFAAQVISEFGSSTRRTRGQLNSGDYDRAILCCDVGWNSHHRAGASASRRSQTPLSRCSRQIRRPCPRSPRLRLAVRRGSGLAAGPRKLQPHRQSQRAAREPRLNRRHRRAGGNPPGPGQNALQTVAPSSEHWLLAGSLLVNANVRLHACRARRPSAASRPARAACGFAAASTRTATARTPRFRASRGRPRRSTSPSPTATARPATATECLRPGAATALRMLSADPHGVPGLTSGSKLRALAPVAQLDRAADF